MTKDKRELLFETAIELRNAFLRAQQHDIISYQNSYQGNGEYIDQFQIFSIIQFKEFAAAAGRQYKIKEYSGAKHYEYSIITEGLKFICITNNIQQGDEPFLIVEADK